MRGISFCMICDTLYSYLRYIIPIRHSTSVNVTLLPSIFQCQLRRISPRHKNKDIEQESECHVGPVPHTSSVVKGEGKN